MDNKQEFILCAAIKRVNSRDCVKHYYNNDIYDIEIGYRHCDIFARFGNKISRKPEDQGFYTSKGRFVNRNKAMYIAWKSSQVSRERAFKLEGFELEKFIFNIYENFKQIDDNFPFEKYFNKLYSEDLY